MGRDRIQDPGGRIGSSDPVRPSSTAANGCLAIEKGSAKNRIRVSSKLESRPWLKPKPGETVQEWNRRTNHSCYACGDFYADLADLDAHEATHG